MEDKIQRAYRSVKFEREIREENGIKKLILRGYPVLFNVETTVYDWYYGEIKETILPSAFDGVDIDSTMLLRSHIPDKVLAKNNVNMRLEIDDTGLFFEAELLNTQIARDTYAEVEAGLIDGMSFGAYISDTVNPETLKRTITHFDKFIEISITPFPAYKEASVIAVTAEQQAKTDAEAQARAEAERKEKQQRDEFFKELETL